jgi:hypothetical protein
MNSICITGESHQDLQLVSEIFQQVGMKLPKPAERDDSTNLVSWHEQLMIEVLDRSDDIQPISHPGKPWEQLANDIFAANMTSNLWGWADPRSTWLLNFWRNFEPRLNFILVCVSPQKMLARAIASETDSISVKAIMNSWQRYHEELLRFHHRNPDRSLLVDAYESAKYPNVLVDRCSEKWQLSLALAAGTDLSLKDPDSLALYLAQQLCREYPQATSLQHEIAATVTRLAAIGPVADTTTPDDSVRIVTDYRRLRDRSFELLQVQAIRDKLDALTQAYADLNGEKDALTKEKSGLAVRRDEMESRLDKAVASHAQQKQDLEERIKETDQENELLLSQLYQIQEELEASFVKNQAHVKAFKAAETNLKQAEQDNELLSMQLRQVQEELEHYFSQHQGVQRQLKASVERWQRMLQRTPYYCDYESIEILSDESSDADATTWRIKNLDAGGRSLPELVFKTIVEQGIAGIIFFRFPGTPDPLTHWPANAANQNEVALIPIGGPTNTSSRLETLSELATSDWDLLQTLIRLLERILEAPSALKLPAHFQPQALKNGLGKLDAILESFPSTLRYDRVGLKREQVNPDYEHLWLRFVNLSFGGKRCPEFEFRLSCAEVRPNHFGSHPKLEFPEESSQAPFEGWFIEAHDDFGAKLELRFALPEPSMDLAVWQRVSKNDRDFLAALIKHLPAILMNLKDAGVKLKRPWEDWIKMAGEMQRVVRLRAAPSSTPLSFWVKMSRAIRRGVAPVQTASVSKTGKAQ